MSTTVRGGIEQGSERDVPSKMNVEGQNAVNTDSAAPALQQSGSGSGTSEDGGENEKKPAAGGKGPAMEKYAYHCESPLYATTSLGYWAKLMTDHSLLA